jgi:hypothetical protein
MFERFTEHARGVVVHAQLQSRSLKHDYIGTEHLLLGLTCQDSLAARALKSFDITLERARAEVVRAVGEGQEVRPGQIPFKPRAKKVIELSLREAQSLGDRHIGTDHLLLGLLREDAGVATRVLRDPGADPEKLREELHRLRAEADDYEPHDVEPDVGEMRWTSRTRRLAIASFEAAKIVRQIFAGAVLVIAGIAAFIEAHSHRPMVFSGIEEVAGRAGTPPIFSGRVHTTSGLSRTAYDVLRIGGWALVIVGGLLVVMGLIRYWAAQSRNLHSPRRG